MRDLDNFREAVSDLALRESAQEVEVEESVYGGVVGTESVLKLAVVDADLDGDGGVDESNEGGADTNPVGVSAIRSAGVAAYVRGETTSNDQDRLLERRVTKARRRGFSVSYCLVGTSSRPRTAQNSPCG